MLRRFGLQFAVVLFAAAALCGTPVAQAQSRVSGLADALLEFERAVKWEVVSDSWVGKRDAWITTVKRARSAAEVASGIATLESSMTWESVQESFRARRPGWVADLDAAATAAEVARLLLELEAFTKWEAVSESWRGARAAWVAKVQKIAG